MSAAGDERSAQSPDPRRPPDAPNRTPFTPRCRTVGLKRKSAGTPSLHASAALPKRTKACEAKKRVGFDDESATAAEAKAGDESSDGADGAVRRRVADKRREVEALRSELRNSEQHNLNQIQELSNKWLCVCQEALIFLYDQLNKNESSTLHSMEDLIINLGINPDLIHFDSNTQEFY